MNDNPGLIGRKLGMTQVFTGDGSVVPCTVIEAETVVVGKRTAEKDGYDALVIGMGERKAGRTAKAQAVVYEKAGIAPKQHVRELRCSAEHAAKFEVGKPLGVADVFEEGQYVDVQGVSRGRGFSGVMRRHNFRGGGGSHGSHEYKRHGGSIGQNMTPGRVFPGMKMAGQHGNATVSVLSQPVIKVVADQNLVLVRGGVPGPRGSMVLVRGAVKKRGKKLAS